ncbi:hypothetical protein Trydic_g18999 [Trypoxylus dichotomus]
MIPYANLEPILVLENFILLYAEEGMPLKWTYDNDPKHTSRRGKSWLVQHKIEVLERPTQSPDLNPIENLRIGLKESVYNPNPKA